jgi:hypothetical protein
VRERTVAAIDDLQHPDQRALVDERNREHATHVVVVIQVDLGVEQRLDTTIGDIDDGASARRQPENAALH